MHLPKSRHFWLPICFCKVFCAKCGAGLKSFSKFCHFCGQKVELDTVTASETDKGATKRLSFQNYAAKKSDERSTHFRSSSSKGRGQKRKDEDPFTQINISIIRFISPDVTTPIHVKTLILKVRNDSEYVKSFLHAAEAFYKVFYRTLKRRQLK